MCALQCSSSGKALTLTHTRRAKVIFNVFKVLILSFRKHWTVNVQHMCVLYGTLCLTFSIRLRYTCVDVVVSVRGIFCLALLAIYKFKLYVVKDNLSLWWVHFPTHLSLLLRKLKQAQKLRYMYKLGAGPKQFVRKQTLPDRAYRFYIYKFSKVEY